MNTVLVEKYFWGEEYANKVPEEQMVDTTNVVETVNNGGV